MSGFLELEIEIVAFARALTDAAEHRPAAVALRDVVDELLNDDRLADAGAAEQSDLSALHERRDQIDDLDAGLEDFASSARGPRTAEPGGGSASARRPRESARPLSTGSPSTFEDAAECRCADRHRDRSARVDHFHAALDAVGRRHGDGANLVAADVLLHFERRRGSSLPAIVHADHAQRVVDLGKVIGLELDVEHRSDDLDDLAGVAHA